MQAVAMEPYADIRRVNLRVTFELIDIHAAEASTASVSGAAIISHLPQLKDRNENVYGKFAVLEQDFWKLDGSFGILPEDYSNLETGWFSDVISGDDGTFDLPPTLTFTFSEDISSIGFTLGFDGTHQQWPTRYHIAVYDGSNALITEDDVENDESQSVVSLPVRNYRKVVFTFQKTSEPHRRVRVCEALFGIIQRFDRNNISSASLTYGADVQNAFVHLR